MADARDVLPLLEVEQLSVSFGAVTAVSSVSFTVHQGQVFGVVGESGAGKSATAKAIIGLLPPGTVTTGSIRLTGEELIGSSKKRLRQIRGGEIGYIFQDALTALDPVRTVGAQLIEALRAHRAVSKAAARKVAGDLLAEVLIQHPDRCLDAYPHQLSGGMRQRVVIASALINEPKLIIADELTSALDVTVQRKVLDLLMNVCANRGAGVILITHDLGVVAQTCDEVAVLYGGIVAEQSDVYRLFDEPRHPYTAALLESLPRLGDKRPFRPIEGSAAQIRGELRRCPFGPRCRFATSVCDSTLPAVEEHDGRTVRCFHPIGSAA